MSRRRPPPPFGVRLLWPPQLSAGELVPAGAIWQFRDNGVTLASDWVDLGFDDTG